MYTEIKEKKQFSKFTSNEMTCIMQLSTKGVKSNLSKMPILPFSGTVTLWYFQKIL